MTNPTLVARLPPERVSTAIWIVLYSLGSPAVPDARYLKIAIATLLSLYLVRLSPERRLAPPTVVSLGFQLGILIWAMLSGFANDALISQRVVMWGLVLLYCWALSLHGLEILFRSFVRASLIALLIGWGLTLLGQASSGYSSNFKWLGLDYRFSGIFNTPNAAGLLATLTLLAIIGIASFKKIYLLVPLISIIGAEYRGGLVAIVGCVFWLGIKALKGSTVSQSLIAYLRLALSIPVGLGIYKFLNTSRTGNGDAANGRGLIWNQCRQYISQQGAFGGGPEFIAREVGLDTQADNSATGSFQFFHCHNQILNDIVNFGYVGMSMSLILTMAAFIIAVRRRIIVLQLVSLVMLIAGLFEAPLNYLGVQGDLWPVTLFWAGILTLSNSNAHSSSKSHEVTPSTSVAHFN